MARSVTAVRLLALVLAVAMAAACSGSPGEELGSGKAAITPTYGVDYSFARPSPSGIRAAGFSFVARYLSNEPAKNLSLGEAQALQAAGLTIVCNWEDSATNSLSGYGQGVADASTAKAQALAVGQPSDRPIYFSVDFDANGSQLGTIEAYFEGVASVIGLSRTGVYGGHYIVNALFNDGKVRWGWQAYAWSYGAWDPRAQFRQIQNGIAGGQEDEDEAVAEDFGQWPFAAAPPPPPPPARGSLDSVTCDQIGGWAQDPSTGGTAIPVDIYLDGPAGTGTGLGRFTAGDARPDLCSAIGSCNHAFDIQPPVSLYDGHAHTVFAYGIAVTPGAANTLLPGSPKTLQCAAALTGDFSGSGSAEVLQFRDDWQSLPTCGRWGSDWSCTNRAATYLRGLGAGNGGAAIYPGATPLVGDVNGDGRDDVLQFNAGWQSIPVCISTSEGWSCENQTATYVGGAGAGNSGTGVYPGATPFVADVNGDGKADVIQYNPTWSTLPVCFATDSGWACKNLDAAYVGGIGAGNAGSGIYKGAGTSVLVGDVNGDGKADLVQYNPGWRSIPVCLSTGDGWTCENVAAEYLGGKGPGNAGSGVYGATSVRLGDMNGDGTADLLQYNAGWTSIPVCVFTDHGWSCENLEATYVGGLGAGNGGSGIYGGANVFVADVNGDGYADVLQYNETWASIPVCFSTIDGWACENLKANAAGGGATGNGGTEILPFGVPLVGRFGGGKASSVLEIDPESAWTTLPLCALDATGWSCTSSSATVY